MTAAERALWLRAEREARKFRPAMQAAILRAWKVVAEELSLAQVERLIAAGAISELASIISEATGEVLDARYTPLVRETFATAAKGQLARMPRQLAGVRFDLLNPNTVRAALGLETTALSTLTTEAAATVRQVVARGVAEGVGPRTIARDLRAAVGLAPNQEAAVANFRAALEAGDFAKARTYGLRDLRYSLNIGEPDTWDVDRFMATTFINAVRDCLREGGWMGMEDNRELGGTFLVGIRDRLYVVDSDFQVGYTADGYDSVGCGRELALGSLYSTEGVPPAMRLTAALGAASRFSTGVRGPFTIEATAAGVAI